MTWYYDIFDDGGEMDVYEDDPEFTGVVKTIKNDGSGFDIPSDVKAVMRGVWEDEANLGKSPVMDVRSGHIMMDMITEDIREGVPPSLQ